MKLKKETVVTVVKIAGFGLSIAGTLLSNWSGKKETDAALAKLVDEKLSNKMGES